jgi:ribosomal protein S18 acetylase RimI-like enzyme
MLDSRPVIPESKPSGARAHDPLRRDNEFRTLGGMSELRAAGSPDLAVVADWIRSAELCRHWAGARVGFPIQLDRLAEEIEFRHAESWCLTGDAGVVGFGQIVPKADARRHLTRLIVDPQARRRGLGRRLTELLVERALAGFAASVSLNVFVDNLPALNLYRSLGFRPAERPADDEDSAAQYMLLVA